MEKSFYVLEDFLSSQELEALLKMVVDDSGYDPKPFFEGTGLLEKTTLDQGQYPTNMDPERILLKVINKVEDYYLSTHEMLGEFMFNRMYGITMLEGAVLPSHRDEDANADGEFDGKKRSHICSLILNDDYDGGELVFDDQGATIKPKAGSMVLFPGYYVSHGVNKVTRGIRRVILVVFHDVLP